MRAHYSNTLKSLLGVGTLCLLSSAHATGTLFRSYLSVKGSDSNACTITAPCRLLPAALATTQPGGEVWIVDSGNFNTGTVQINQSVTVLAIPGALGSLVVNNADALDIYATSSKVTLRNLSFVVLSDTNGSSAVSHEGQNTQLIVEDSEFAEVRYALKVQAPGSSTIAIRSRFRDNFHAVSISGDNTTSALVDHCTIVNATQGVVADSGSVTTVSNTSIANSYVGVYSDNAPTIIQLENDVLVKNNTAAFIYGDEGGPVGTIQTANDNIFQFNKYNLNSGSLTTVSKM